MGKGQRLRIERAKEKKMREDSEAMFNRVDAMVNDLDNMPDGPYYSCSFDTEHEETCSMVPRGGVDEGFVRAFQPEGMQPIPCIEMTKMEVAIFHERKLWESVQMDIGSVTIPPIELSAKITAVEHLLMEQGIATQEDLDRIYQVVFFKALREVRETLAPSVQSARRQELVASAMPSLLGPNGRPILH